MTGAPVHIMVHDYCGHPFTAEFSRQLARNGWRVSHVFFAQDGGPKGRNARLPDDPDGLSFHALDIAGEYSKTDFLKRRKGDLEYGKVLAAFVRDHRPDLVLSGNTPTETQEYLTKACGTIGAKFVYWCQDFYSIAASRLLAAKLPGIGHLIGAYYTFLERRQMRRADHVVHITDGFLAQTDRWRIPRHRVSVIPNWGALDEIPLLDRDTDWANRQGFSREKRVIYSGTLAMKHNPDLLAAIAEAETDRADVVVVGFGVGADALAQESKSRPNLTVLPIQPFDEFPQVLASADVLTAVIEEDAGEFSVPSKVLSYLCAGRPIVLAAPSTNLAARIVKETGAGLVVEPHDVKGLVAAAQAYLDDPDRAAEAGRAGRAYAEATFDLETVSLKFEGVFRPTLNRAGESRTEPAKLHLEAERP